MAENRTPAGQFKPGQSGNPGGRPKGFAALIREATDDGQDLIEVALALLHGEDDRIKIQAVTWLADRGWGKAAQVIDVAESNGRLEVKLSFDPSQNGSPKVMERVFEEDGS